MREEARNVERLQAEGRFWQFRFDSDYIETKQGWGVTELL